VDDTTSDVVDAAHAALVSPQMDAVLRESFRDAFRELKAGIEQPKWTQKGIGVAEAASRLAHGARAPAMVSGPS